MGAVGFAHAQAPASGARLRLIGSFIEGDAVVSAPMPPLDSLPVRRMGAACGAARACAAGFDLRVVRISSADSAAAGGLLRTTVTLENIGRAASPASELVLCLTTGGYRCEQSPGGGLRISIPPLRSAEQFVLTRDVRAPLGGAALGRTRVSVMIDPERLTPETIWTDNFLTRDVVVESPDLAISSLAPAPETQGLVAVHGPLVIDIRVTNRGRTVSLPATEVEFGSGGSEGNSMYCGQWGDAETRVALPLLAPGQTWTARVEVTGRAVSCRAAEFGIYARVDPDERATWTDRRRLSADRRYTVR